jgi:hypothetical protein
MIEELRLMIFDFSILKRISIRLIVAKQINNSTNKRINI